MALTFSTGFVTVQDNQNTSIDLRAYSNLESARIRWRGRRIYAEGSQTVSSTNNINTDFFKYLDVPAIPSGWTFKNIVISTIVTNKSSEIISEITAFAGISAYVGTGQVEYYLLNDEQVSAFYTYSTTYVAQTLHYATSSPSGYVVRLLANAILTYWKYANSSYPQTLINSKTTSYSGELEHQEVSEWVTLKGLDAGQLNSIRHDVINSNTVDVEIEYTVSDSPTVSTQEAIDISFTTGKMKGVVTNTGGSTVECGFQYGATPELGSSISKGEPTVDVPFTHQLSALEYASTKYYRAYATNSDGTSYGDILSFTTLYPNLEAPTREEPINGEKITDRRPYFVFTLDENTDNDATKYHARIRFSEYVNMQNPTTYESSTSQIGWELWNGSSWEAFPSGGVDPDSKVRFRPLANLNFATYYWDCASHDGTQYGYDSNAWSFRVMISADGLYLLVVNSIEYNAYSLSVLETANGQIGKIGFELNNEDGATNTAIQYGHTVNLSVRDVYGNAEEYIGKVRQKQVSGYALNITAILGDGILAERLIEEDYTSQDIGQTVKDIIDDYCSPLTTTNVNTSTGISAPIIGIDKKPLEVLEELRRQYGTFYYVDKDWDVHFYLPSAISSSYVAIKHGGWT